MLLGLSLLFMVAGRSDMPLTENTQRLPSARTGFACDVCLTVDESSPQASRGHGLQTNPDIERSTFSKLNRSMSPSDALETFRGIPYRFDGTINEAGQYVLFNKPDVPLPTPGLNCSGFVLSASRLILGRNITLAEAIRDREKDSGSSSPDGRDWDFGFDLIMNISEGMTRSLLVPDGMALPEHITGKNAPSFDISDPNFATSLTPHIKQGNVYLLSFSKHKTLNSPPFIHYHTGVAVREDSNVWIYSTTRNSGKVIRHNLTSDKGREQFLQSFKNTSGSHKRLMVVEVRLLGEDF